MGIETILFAAFTGLQAISKMNAANAQAKSIVQQGEINAENSAKQTRLKAASANASFLNSGVTLDGTPNLAINDIFDVGLKDVNQIRSNANSSAKNTIAKGRSDAISGIMTNFAGASAAGSMGSMFTTAGSYLPDSFAYGLNSAGGGNLAYDMLSKSDARAGL